MNRLMIVSMVAIYFLLTQVVGANRFDSAGVLLVLWADWHFSKRRV